MESEAVCVCVCGVGGGGGGGRGLKPIYSRETKLQTYWSSSSSVKHPSETHIITNDVMKQSKRLNGELEPEHKKP